MKHTIQKGFTIIEMLAVLAIFSILTAIVVFNYAKFRSDTILTNMAYEVALSIREAQIYGVSARSSVSGNSADFTRAYGIYIPTIPTNAYYLFSDTDPANSGTGDKKFTGTDCSSPSGDTCVTPYTLQQNIKITDVYVCVNGGRTDSNNFSILFKRPNPEPIFSKNGDDPGDFSQIQITLTANDGTTSRYVRVANNGQISVVNNPLTCVD
jgi:prepilin-type N-terminal cleavage/methylation domain-containing protein